MNKIGILFILQLIIPYYTFSQADSIKTTEIISPIVTNINITKQDSVYVITYFINGSDPNQKLLVDVEIQKYDQFSRINATSFTGDINVITGGGAKKIYWYYKKDFIYTNEKLMFKINAYPIEKIRYTNYLTESLIMPGLGNYNLGKKKSAFIYSALAYGAIAISINKNFQAHKAYSKYLNSSSKLAANFYYNKAKEQQTISLISAASAAFIWSFNLITLSTKIARINVLLDDIPNLSFFKNKSKCISNYSDTVFIQTKDDYKNQAIKIDNQSIVMLNKEKNTNIINKNEVAYINFYTKNIGDGDAPGLSVKTSSDRRIKGLRYVENIPLGKIKPGDSVLVKIPVYSNDKLRRKNTKLKFNIIGPDDLISNSGEFKIKTNIQRYPAFQITKEESTSERIDSSLNKKITLDIVIKNTGSIPAKRLIIKFNSYTDIKFISDNQFFSKILYPNEDITLKLVFVANKNTSKNNIPVELYIKEKNISFKQEFNVPIE